MEWLLEVRFLKETLTETMQLEANEYSEMSVLVISLRADLKVFIQKLSWIVHVVQYYYL